MSPSWHGQNFQFLSYIPNLVLEPFLDLKLFVCWPFYFRFGLRSWFADILAWVCSDFHFGKIFHFFGTGPNAFVKCWKLFLKLYTLYTLYSSYFGHCLKLHIYFELYTSHHFVNVSFGTIVVSMKLSMVRCSPCDEHVTVISFFWFFYEKHSKLMEPYFSRKMSFSQKSAQNGLKWTVSIISQNGLKVKVIFFSDILHEVKGT